MYGEYRCPNGHIATFRTQVPYIRCQSQRAGYQCRLWAKRVPHR